MRPDQITPEVLADAIGISLPRLWWLARCIEDVYRPARQQRIGNKHRLIDEPNRYHPVQPRRLFRRLHRWLQTNSELFHPAAFGCIKRRSTFSHARVHLGHRFVATRDVKKCYPSITPEKLKNVLNEAGFQRGAADLLTMLLTVRGRVPQGSPLSGDAQNLYFSLFDHRVAAAAKSANVTYGRFADDIVVSGNKQASVELVADQIEREIQALGLTVNLQKKKENGLQVAGEEQLVHSIRVNSPSGTRPCRSHERDGIQLAESFVRACRSVDPTSLEAIARKRSQLFGMLNYFKQADRSPVKYLKQQLSAGERIVASKLRAVGLSAYQNKWWLVSNIRNEPKRIALNWKSLGTRMPICALPSTMNSTLGLQTGRAMQNAAESTL